MRSEGGAGEEGKEPVKEFEAIELCDKKEVRTSERYAGVDSTYYVVSRVKPVGSG